MLLIDTIEELKYQHSISVYLRMKTKPNMSLCWSVPNLGQKLSKITLRHNDYSEYRLDWTHTKQGITFLEQ